MVKTICHYSAKKFNFDKVIYLAYVLLRLVFDF